MYTIEYKPTAQYKPATQSLSTIQSMCATQATYTTQSVSNIQATYTTQSVSSVQCRCTTQSVSTIQAMYALQPKSSTKSQEYIVITGLGRRCVVLKSQVSTYQVLISYIHAFFPGTSQRLHHNTILLPIVIQTCDLPAYKGYIVDIQPDVWATIIADIDNIQVSVANPK